MSGQEAFREQALQEESFASNLELHLFILSCLIVLIIVCSPWSVSCDRACWLPPSFVFSCIPPTAISCLCFCLFSGIMPFPFMGFLFSTWTRCLQVSWLWAISATIVAEILNILMRKTAGRNGGGVGGRNDSLPENDLETQFSVTFNSLHGTRRQKKHLLK